MAVTIGYNSYTQATAPSGLLTDYEIQSIPPRWTDKRLMVGIEGGWFVSDFWKLNLGGGLSFTHNPGYSALPGSSKSTITYL